MMDVVIKNCRVVKPIGIFDTGIAIKNGKIAVLAPDGDLPQAQKTIDGKGNFVLPGLVDAHMHFPWPPGKDFAERIGAETKACLYGGCTTAVHMLRGNQDILREMSSFIGLYEQSAYMDVGLNAMVLSDEHLKQFEGVVDSGIVSFKFYMPYRVGTEPVKGLPQLDDGLMYLGFKKLGELFEKGLNVHARVHCENIEIFSRMKQKFIEERFSPQSWHQVRPSICEIEAIRRSLCLSEITGCPLTIIHMSAKESVDLIAQARGEGIRVFGETCPQYLTLSTDKTDRNLSKVNPPIRERQDNRKLWEGIQRGVIDLVGTDHWPVHKSKKADFWKGEVGLSIVECWLGILLSEGVNQGRISLEKLVETCCYKPAMMFGLAPQKGVVEVGSDADLTIVDLEKEVVVGEMPVYSSADFNIFDGWRLKGWPVLTMLRGKVVMDQGRICGDAGDGRFMRSKNR